MCRDAVQIAPTDMLRPLLVRIAAADEQALEALYRTAGSRLKGVSRAVLRSRQDAEEVVADVLLYVWMNAHRYDDSRGSVMTWLAIITRNRSIDRVRKHRVTVKLDDKYLAGQGASTFDEPERQLGRLRQVAHASAILARQSPLRQELLSLALLKGLPHQQIAAVAGLPLGTVKSHIRRSLLAIRAQLQTSHS